MDRAWPSSIARGSADSPRIVQFRDYCRHIWNVTPMVTDVTMSAAPWCRRTAIEQDEVTGDAPCQNVVAGKACDRCSSEAARRSRAEPHARLLACVQLPGGRDDLSQGQPAAQGAAEDGTRQAPSARPLGRKPGVVVRLGAPESGHRQARPRRDLRGRSWPRRARRARARLSRRHLLRDLSRQERRRGRDAEILQAVLVPWAHRQPCDAGDAGFDS